MEILKILIIIVFTVLPFINAQLNLDERNYRPLEIECNFTEKGLILVFLRPKLKRKCICKDGVYHCRTVYPTVGYEVFLARVQKWLRENYDPDCVSKTHELIVKGWTCLCLEKKTYWCTKLPKKEIIPILRER